jgi:hypothetical protein
VEGQGAAQGTHAAGEGGGCGSLLQYNIYYKKVKMYYIILIYCFVMYNSIYTA